MKSSIYNYIITDDEYSYWYNGFSHQYFLLPLDLGNKIKEILKSPAAISQLPRKLYDKLQAGGFIVEDGVNELELVINENTKAIKKTIIWSFYQHLIVILSAGTAFKTIYLL